MGRQTLTHIISIMAPQRYSSDSSDATALGKPLKFEFSGREAKNRFLKAAMTERISSWDPKDFKARGIPSKNLINVYKRWGEGGYGNILTGNIMIEYDQLEAMGNPIIPPMQNSQVLDSKHSRNWPLRRK